MIDSMHRFFFSFKSVLGGWNRSTYLFCQSLHSIKRLSPHMVPRLDGITMYQCSFLLFPWSMPNIYDAWELLCSVYSKYLSGKLKLSSFCWHVTSKWFVRDGQLSLRWVCLLLSGIFFDFEERNDCGLTKKNIFQLTPVELSCHKP